MKKWVWLHLPILLICQVAAAEPKQKMAVLDLNADTCLDPGTIKALNELLLTEVHRLGAYEVLGSSDISSMLNLEERRIQLSGCGDDSCLAEIGGALGVSLLLVASVGAVGEKYLVSVKILDVLKARVVERVTETVDKDDTVLIAAIRRAVVKVCLASGAPIKPIEPVAGVYETTGSTVNWPAWITLGLATFAAGAGCTMAVLAWKDQGDMGDLLQGTDRWNDLKDSTEKKALAADVLFGVAGAAAITTLVLFLIDGDDEEAVSAGIAPTAGGATVTFGLRF
jgi:hypothetical protein